MPVPDFHQGLFGRFVPAGRRSLVLFMGNSVHFGLRGLKTALCGSNPGLTVKHPPPWGLFVLMSGQGPQSLYR